MHYITQIWDRWTGQGSNSNTPAPAPAPAPSSTLNAAVVPAETPYQGYNPGNAPHQTFLAQSILPPPAVSDTSGKKLLGQ